MKTAPRSGTKIESKIALLAVCPVILALIATGVTLLVQQKQLGHEADTAITEQARNETAKIAQNVYLLCNSTDARNQAELSRGMDAVHRLLSNVGSLSLSNETVAWQASNQVTKQVIPVVLPKLLVGAEWLGQVTTAGEQALIVDEAKRLTGVFCTVFQRMNEAGDMLRVCTNVVKEDGNRAVGTYIAARDADSTENVVIKTVLRGETYRGRAYVVNDWHTAAYEPIWDAGKKRVIGMLYVGIAMNTSNRELREAISKIVVGRTGSVFVLGATGDERGRFLIADQGHQAGENVWDARDAEGRPYIQNMVQLGNKLGAGEVGSVDYATRRAGEKQVRARFAAIVGFPAWDWVIAASAYEDDFAEMRMKLNATRNAMLRWVAGVGLVTAVLALVVGVLFARTLVGPITHLIADLSESSTYIASAARQVSASSQSVAQGTSEQAASLEESSASLEEMSSMTKRNAESATRANELARMARQVADGGATDMEAMARAMNEIKTSSDDIAKIIKTIDEIAFQTNILALNAAVEAARAGEAGMGFAVVADEVRSLAHRSAQAARETASKIEGAISKTTQGVEISAKVSTSLAGIVERVREVDTLIAEVATASREQSQGLEQLNAGIGQMDKVVQANASSAEESSAAAQQLNAQAAMLKEGVARLQKVVGTRTKETLQPSEPHEQFTAPSAQKPAATRNAALKRQSVRRSEPRYGSRLCM